MRFEAFGGNPSEDRAITGESPAGTVTWPLQGGPVVAKVAQGVAHRCERRYTITSLQ